MVQPLLEGTVDNRDQIIEDLQAQNAQLVLEIRMLKAELQTAKTTGARGVASVKRVLSPLKRALDELWGEMELIPADGAPAAAADGRIKAVWENWKQRLPATASKIIDALLIHGELNTQGLATVTGLHRTTIPKGVYELNKNNLIVKNAGRFSLKQF